ncbi:hypothetical protein CHH27_23635 [Labrenzia sp. VG12]|nr:hypothetical protein CHH27_23635 [Labrenzia sp. VG12]
MQNTIQYVKQTETAYNNVFIAHVESGKNEDNNRTKSISERCDWASFDSFPPFRSLLAKNFEDVETWRAEELNNRKSYIELIGEYFGKVGTDFDVVLLGDYRPMSFRQFFQFTEVRKPEIVLLDDGSVSRYVMEYRDTGRKSEEVTRGLLVPLGEHDPFRVMEPASLTYFTIYNETIPQADNLLLNEQFTSFSPEDFEYREGEVWVCGVNHCEAQIAKQNEFLELCSRVAGWAKGKKIIYFPHRREDKEKVELVRKIMGAEISSYKYGLEEYVQEHKRRPFKVFVFGSTVADTLSRIFSPLNTVIVAVPSDNYFTKSVRSQHVRNIIVDNIRKNECVQAIPAFCNGVHTWLNSKVPTLSSHLARVPMGEMEPRMPFKTLRGAEVVGEEGEWLRIAETKLPKIHRIVIGDVSSRKAKGLHCHMFRIRAEERYGFKFRLVNKKNSSDFVEVTAAFDVESNVKSLNEFGQLALEIDVNATRESVVTVFFQCNKNVDCSLQLITLHKSTTFTSAHDGNPSAGFSIAAYKPGDQRVVTASGLEGEFSGQVAIPSDKTAFMLVGSKETPELVCVHVGFLKSFRGNQVSFPFLDMASIRCFNLGKPGLGSPVVSSQEGQLAEAPSNSSEFLLSSKLGLSYPLFEDDIRRRKISLLGKKIGKTIYQKSEKIFLGEADIRSGKKILLGVYEGKNSGKLNFYF